VIRTKPLNPHLQELKVSIAKRLTATTGQVVDVERNNLGQIHRRALDARVDFHEDPDIAKAFLDYCSELEGSEDRFAHGFETNSDLEKLCPLLAEWLGEGMSPVAYFVSEEGGYTSADILDTVLYITKLDLTPQLLLGNLSLAEFSRALADMMCISKPDYADMRRVSDSLPGMLAQDNWINLVPGQFTTHEDMNSRLEWVAADIIPTMVLDQTHDEDAYGQAEEFFFAPKRDHYGKLFPLFLNCDNANGIYLLETVGKHLWGDWSSDIADKKISNMLVSPSLFSMRGEKWHFRMSYLVHKAVASLAENPDLGWPHLLSRLIFDQIHMGAPEESKSMWRDSFLRIPGFHGLINSKIETILKLSNVQNIWDVGYSTAFLDLIDKEKKAELIEVSVARASSYISTKLKNDKLLMTQSQIEKNSAVVDPEVMNAFSSNLRAMVDLSRVPRKFKARFKSLLWIQCQGLKGKASEKQAVEFCDKLPTAEIKVMAANYLDLPARKLVLNEFEQEQFLQRDLGL
jgi:hypothetical protein